MKKMPANTTIILAGGSFILLILLVLPEKKSYATVDMAYTLTDTSKWKEVSFSKNQLLNKMAYADTANFMHQQIYPCAKCFLRLEVANALLKANALAANQQLKLAIFDCYRPKKYQQKMFELVKNPDYVAEPIKGSMHNKGLAVDIGLANNKDQLLDFGCDFDDFSEKAHFDYPQLTTVAKKNRILLRDIMIKAGFEPYKNEWWHFNYKQVDYPVDEFIWNCN
jgi:zinc D-Ala-D-Ala dipeptidase